MRRALAGTVLLLVAACGGGGGGGGGEPAPAGPIALEFGIASSTAPTRKTATIPNVRRAPATVTAGPATGPFALDPADLPATIPAEGSLDLGIVFSPTGAGETTGSVVVVLTSGDRVDEVRVDTTATAEGVTLLAAPTTLAFGEVLAGTSKTLDLRVGNLSSVSGAPVTTATLPAGCSLVGTPLPATIAPGEELVLPIRYDAATVGAYEATVTLSGWSPGESLDVPVTATTGGAVVTDFGTQSLDGALRTQTLSVDVPADAISLSLEGIMAAGNTVGLAEWTGPDGTVYENTSGTGAYLWIPGDECFSTTVPNTDKANVQLVPGGGTYTFRLYRMSGTGTSMTARAIVERRPGATGAVGVIDLDVWLANAIAPKAATAASDTRLQAILQAVDGILDQSGIRLGDVRYHDVSNTTYDDVTTAEFPAMLRLSSSVSDPRLNLFFVRTALGGGVLGVAATIGGPRVNGTGMSGVMSLYDGGFSASFVGLVAAHEIGHFIGLYHTVEQSGAHDFVDDTAECPASGTNAACPTAGGGYLMHWQAVGGSTLSTSQTKVILGHPCVDADLPPVTPASGTSSFLVRRAVRLAAEAEAPSGPWCATCDRCRPKGR